MQLSPCGRGMRRARRRLAKRIRVLPGERIIVSTRLLLDALFDPEIARSAAELLALAHGTAMGDNAKEARVLRVLPVVGADHRADWRQVVAKIVGTEEALLSLICQDCCTGNADPALLVALQRDLGCTPEFIHEPTETTQ